MKISLPFPVSSFRFGAIYHLLNAVQRFQDLFPTGRANDMPAFHVNLVLEISTIRLLDGLNEKVEQARIEYERVRTALLNLTKKL